MGSRAQNWRSFIKHFLKPMKMLLLTKNVQVYANHPVDNTCKSYGNKNDFNLSFSNNLILDTIWTTLAIDKLKNGLIPPMIPSY